MGAIVVSSSEIFSILYRLRAYSYLSNTCKALKIT